MSKSNGVVALSLALLRSSRAASDDLRAALERRGLRIVVDESLAQFANGLRWNQGHVDALLLDLEQAEEAEFVQLDALLERVALPIVFHDGQIPADDDAWLQRLIGKIEDAVATRASEDAAGLSLAEPVPDQAAALRCWVLGASFGGPEALKRFLCAMPAPPPATALIIGQHIGDGFVDVMAGQLSRATAFKVVPASDGALLESGRVYVAPVLERLRIDAAGRIRLQRDSERHTYLPAIDRLMEEVAHRFGRRSGAIVFSGMGDDGARGSVAIVRAGGMVWAQDAASCACDSMPNCARATGAVTRDGTPEQLAGMLAEHLAATVPVASIRTA
ncbi:MAG TPA: chemotaxis protein CheB [Gammaproteobacteria bacterium]|nr:chemotaxis protein CheB [Gammaproteobacteria bacterium]